MFHVEFRVLYWLGLIDGIYFPRNGYNYKNYCMYLFFALVVSIFGSVKIADWYWYVVRNAGGTVIEIALGDGSAVIILFYTLMVRTLLFLKLNCVSTLISDLALFSTKIPESPELKVVAKCYKISFWVMLILIFSNSILYTLVLTKNLPINSLFYPLGQTLHAVTGFFCVGAYISATHFCNYGFIIIASNALLFKFHSFCDKVESVAKIYSESLPISDPKAKKTTTDEKKDTRSVQNDLLQEFDRLKQTFRTFDEICGPLLFLTLIWSLYTFITSLNSLIEPDRQSDTEEGIFYFIALVVSLACNIMDLSTLELGEIFSQDMETRMESLKCISICMSNTSPMKNKLIEVVEVMGLWKWTMNAAGFYPLSRKGFSQIAATMITYIIVLVQMNVGLKDPESKSGNSTTLQNLTTFPADNETEC